MKFLMIASQNSVNGVFIFFTAPAEFVIEIVLTKLFMNEVFLRFSVASMLAITTMAEWVVIYLLL